jgi:hypothetical protein
MSRKVFTPDEILTAEDVNSFLMDQTVMSFAGTAARGSAIPFPVEGMVTYLEDIDDLRTYNGSSWVSPYGMTLVNSTTFTSVSSQTINNVFTSAYDDYKILVTIDSSATSGDPTWQLTVGGTATTSNYGSIHVQSVINNPTVYTPAANSAGTDEWRLSIQSSTLPSTAVDITLFSPNRARRTMFTKLSTGAFAAGNEFFMITASGHQTDSTQFDGFRMNFAGNTSGRVKVYGLRS